MNRKFLTLVCAGLLLAGCRKAFLPALDEANSAFAEKNYINTVDIINTSLPNWREKDGNEKKAEAYSLLGKAYHEMHNVDKSIEAYQQALSLSDNMFDAAYDMGTLLLAKRQLEQARKAFLDALRMKPNDPLALLGLGNTYFELGRKDEALEAFHKVLEVSPGVHDALENIRVLKAGKPAAKKPAVKKAAAKPAKKAPAKAKKPAKSKRR